jgi:hypothetical protein
MHAYSTDATDRNLVPIKLGASAVGFAFLIFLVVRANGLTIPWWIDLPGPIGIGVLLLTAYDKTFWRWRLGPFRLSRIPYMGGIWEGTLTSSFQDDPGPHRGRLLITQRWSTILVRYEPEAGTSHSYSTMAAVRTSDSTEPSLAYEYFNEPRYLEASSMAPHRGVARLRLNSSGALSGDYYTGRGRSTGGQMEFRRVEE